MLYTIIQQLPELLQLENIQGFPKLDSTASSLVFKNLVLNITTFVNQEDFAILRKKKVKRSRIIIERNRNWLFVLYRFELVQGAQLESG
jgi:hypothetical protein